MDTNSYIVSARKYRPTTFSSVVGQKNLTATLKNAIATNRLAHSYLFCGSRGVGKTSCARIFAKTINCEHRTPEGDPCNECESCRAFNEGRSLNIIELDAASNNGVEDMRKLTDQVMVPPTNGRFRVFIIDEVHMLSSNAFNAFLKTLEEPPSYIIFILATTEKHKIIPTILSRCQIYDFNRITVGDITDHLEYVATKENITAERKALAVIAAQADGAMRDALSIFDQIAASSRGNVTYESVIENLNILDTKHFFRLMEAFRKSDVAEALLIFKEIQDSGFSTRFFINGLQEFIRNLMVARDPKTLPLLDATDDEKQAMAKEAQNLPPEFFYMALSLINDADMKYREAANKTFLTELLLIKLCQLLSPSPVFRGKEEGHLDSLRPLGQTGYDAAAHNSGILPQRPKATATPTQLPEQQPAQQQTAGIEKAERMTAPPPTRNSTSGRGLKHVGLKVHSIKTGNPPTQQQPAESEQPVEGTAGSNIVTADALAKAWHGYAESVPDKKILVNLMKVAQPVVDAENTNLMSLTLPNQYMRTILEADLDPLMKHLRTALGNDNLTLNIIVEEGETPPQMWSERDILDNMLDKHPEMAKFVGDLGLSLS